MLELFKNNIRPTSGCLFIVAILLVQACHSDKSTNNKSETTEAVSIVEATFEKIIEVQLEFDTISFAIDELSSGYTSSLQYIEDGRPALSLYNKAAHSIDLYDFNKREMYERITLEKEGPNGVGPSPVGVWFLSPDSIVVTNKFDLFLVNRQAKVINKFRLNMPELGGFPDIILKTNHPIIRKGNKLIASIYPQKDVFKYSDLKNWKNFVEFDLENGETRAFGDLPDLMQDRILGFNYVDKSYVFNGEDIIISFYPSKDLYKISYPFDKSLERIKIDNPNFEDVKEMVNKNPSDFMNYTRHYLMNNSFDGIYFNGTHYLRISQKGISEEELNKRDWAKWKVIQVFDKSFNLLLEKDLKSKYGNYQMTIPFEDSFLIAIGRDSEDIMNFVKINVKQ
ncbi:MAG: hypothetical protein ACJAXB_002294 [Candidatus Endobugula sp.]|jgi:hypothetical protein